MAENPAKALILRQKPKVMVRKGALSVINGDINTRKRTNNSHNQNCKSQKQENLENNLHALKSQKPPVFGCEKGNILKLKWQPQKQEFEIKPRAFDTQTDLEQGKEIIDLTADENSLPSSTNDILLIDESPINPVINSTRSTVCDDRSSKKDFLSLRRKKNEETQITDFIWCTPYRNDIYIYFKNVERKFRPNAFYIEKQPDITFNMRSVLIDWFIEVGEEYKLQVETLHLAVSYVDRFLSHMSVLRGKLQLVGTASLFLAAKYEEIYPPELTDFVYITDDTYSKKQILRMEHLILKVLNFDVSVPTAYTFLQIYCSMCNASEMLMYLSQYICELSLLDGDPFLKFSPSIIGAASLALANYVLGFDMWDDDIETSSGYNLADITYCVLCLYNKYSAMSSCPHQAIHEKYKSPKYSSVATIPQPKDLIFPAKCATKRVCRI